MTDEDAKLYAELQERFRASIDNPNPADLAVGRALIALGEAITPKLKPLAGTLVTLATQLKAAGQIVEKAPDPLNQPDAAAFEQANAFLFGEDEDGSTDDDVSNHFNRRGFFDANDN